MKSLSKAYIWWKFPCHSNLFFFIYHGIFIYMYLFVVMKRCHFKTTKTSLRCLRISWSHGHIHVEKSTKSINKSQARILECKKPHWSTSWSIHDLIMEWTMLVPLPFDSHTTGKNLILASNYRSMNFYDLIKCNNLHDISNFNNCMF